MKSHFVTVLAATAILISSAAVAQSFPGTASAQTTPTTQPTGAMQSHAIRGPVKFGPGSHGTISSPQYNGGGSWSCTISAFAGKVGSDRMWGQGFNYCDQETASMYMTVWVDHYQPLLGTCIWTQWYQAGKSCVLKQTQGGWCPADGSDYVPGIIGQGSGVWGIEVDVSVTAYDGSWAQAQVLSGDVNF